MTAIVDSSAMDALLDHIKNNVTRIYPTTGNPTSAAEAMAQSVVTDGELYAITNSPGAGGGGQQLVYNGIGPLTVNAGPGTVATVCYTDGTGANATVLYVEANVTTPPAVVDTDELTIGTLTHTVVAAT